MITAAIATAAVLLFSGALALALGRGIHIADDRADVTRRASYPPPVPPSRPRTDDASWLPEWVNAPEEIDEEAAMNREFVSMISNEWVWDEADQ